MRHKIILARIDECTGCEACAQICPRDAISMRSDKEGFLRPRLDKDRCIGCNLCVNTCPVINKSQINTPISVYTARSNQENNGKSSSGAVFPLLAQLVIKKSGVVFGAKFDNNYNVVHTFVEDIDKLFDFYGAKYSQSTIGQAYKQAKTFLDAGREVLFSGTPCQITGLKKFLKRDYTNLLTVDIVCKGVPSPRVWNDYVHQLLKKLKINTKEEIKINFRDKSTGWETYSFSIQTLNKKYSIHKDNNVFLQGFYKNLFNRPSCDNCTEKCYYSSDLRLGDAWGFNKGRWADGKGVSLVIVNTERGNNHLSRLMLDKEKTSLGIAVNSNPAISQSFSSHINRGQFFASKHPDITVIINKCIKRSVYSRIISKIKKISKS